VQNYDNEVNMWFTEAIARPCTFVRCLSSKTRHCLNKDGREGLCRDLQSKLSFANEAQLLLISEGSVNDLNSRLISSMPIHFFSNRLTSLLCRYFRLLCCIHFVSFWCAGK